MYGYDVFERLLAEKGVKAADVSRATGVSTATLSSWKSGKYVPKMDKIEKIAEYFDVPVEVFSEAKRKPKAVFKPRLHPMRYDGKLSESLARWMDEEISRSVQEIIEKAFSDLTAENPNIEFDMALVDSYHAADPGTQAAVRKLLDIEDKTEERDISAS